jgi:hypothetical protein
MNFLKLMLVYKLVKSRGSSSRVSVVVGRTINRVFSEVEVTREDSIGRVVVVSERINFSKPEVTVGAMKVEIDNTEGFAC